MGTAIGLDIGSTAVRAVQVTSRRDTLPQLDVLGQVVLPAGAVHLGVVHDADAVVESASILLKEFGFKRRAPTVIGLANEHVIVRRVTIPRIGSENFLPQLRLAAQEYIPVPMEDVEFDYEYIDEVPAPDQTMLMRLLLVAADKAMVAQTLSVVRAAGFRPEVVDLDGFAAVRALQTPMDATGRFGEGSGEVVVDIGADTTSMTIHAAGIPRFVRTIPMGGALISESLASAYDLDWNQAETVKSILPGPSSPYATLLDERISQLVEEIRTSIAYYRAASDAVDVHHIILTGGSSLLPGLDARIGGRVGLDVSFGRPLGRLSTAGLPFDATELEAAQPFFGVAVGLALRGLE